MRNDCDCWIFILPRLPPSRMVPRRPPPKPERANFTSPITAKPASTPLVAAATGAESGIGSTGARSITRASGTGSARTGRLRPSSEEAIEGASLLPGPEVLLVHAVALGDLAAHALHRAVHGLVRLEDPAHLAAALGRLLGHVEVLAVEQAGHARVLPLGLDAQEADAHLVDPRQLPEELDP